MPATSNGGDVHRGLSHLVPHPRLPGQAQHRVALVDDAALLGHQVQAVADRVHQQHVGPRSTASDRG